MRTRVSTIPAGVGDGYWVREDENGQPRIWWINNYPGAGGGGAPPAWPEGGYRHYLVNTGFNELMGLDQNPAAFEAATAQQYGVRWMDFTAAKAQGTRALTVAPPAAGGGGGGGGAWQIVGGGSWAQIVAEGLAAISAPPEPPDVVAGDDKTNWENTYVYMQALAAHARRDEIIRLFGDGIGLALDKMGMQTIRAADLARIVTKGFAVLAKLPEAPDVLDPTVAGGNEDNFSNLFDYLKFEADYWKRDEALGAIGHVAEEVLRRAA